MYFDILNIDGCDLLGVTDNESFVALAKERYKREVALAKPNPPLWRVVFLKNSVSFLGEVRIEYAYLGLKTRFLTGERSGSWTSQSVHGA